MLLWSMVERLPYWAVSRQTGVCGGRYTTRIVGDTTDIATQAFYDISGTPGAMMIILRMLMHECQNVRQPWRAPASGRPD